MLVRMIAVRGFTLLELLVVLGIVAIVGSIAVPSYQSFLQQERHTRTVNQLHSLYKFARSEAIKRDTEVVLARVPNNLNHWHVQVPKQKNQVIRYLALNDSAIIVKGSSSIPFNTRGGTSSQAIEISDPKAFANTKWLCIFPSGQLVVQAASCPKAGV